MIHARRFAVFVLLAACTPSRQGPPPAPTPDAASPRARYQPTLDLLAKLEAGAKACPDALAALAKDKLGPGDDACAVPAGADLDYYSPATRSSLEDTAETSGFCKRLGEEVDGLAKKARGATERPDLHDTYVRAVGDLAKRVDVVVVASALTHPELKEGMVGPEAFKAGSVEGIAYLYPLAEGRFTCGVAFSARSTEKVEYLSGTAAGDGTNASLSLTDDLEANAIKAILAGAPQALAPGRAPKPKPRR